MPGAEESVVRKLPIGPLVGIMPWNFPYYQVARFAAPNLMLGNTILLKHAPSCPQSALLMEEIFVAAGLPADAYVNIFATNDQIADMIADPRVQGVSLTGSERAGAAVAEVAGRNLKKVVLELGGSDAFIVLDTDDMASTVKAATRGRMSNTGQACNAAKRFIVLEPYYDEFVAKLTESFKAMLPGDPLDPKCAIGPAVLAVRRRHPHRADRGRPFRGRDAARRRQPRRRSRRVRRGDPAGRRTAGDARVLRGALRPGRRRLQGQGRRRGGRAGQLLVVRPVSGSVWSTDLEAAREVADRLEVGMAFVNEHGTTLPGLPFGGVKRSGVRPGARPVGHGRVRQQEAGAGLEGLIA